MCNFDNRGLVGKEGGWRWWENVLKQPKIGAEMRLVRKRLAGAFGGLTWLCGS
jgi:hypothetical protein